MAGTMHIHVNNIFNIGNIYQKNKMKEKKNSTSHHMYKFQFDASHTHMLRLDETRRFHFTSYITLHASRP